jgi:pyridoxal 5-phosphate dependent beta-lyase
VGLRLREMAGELVGWQVVHPHAPASTTTALRSTAGHDVPGVRERLLHEHRVLTSVCLRWRAPLEMGTTEGPWLRLSPHVDLDEADLERLADVLSGV